MSENAHFVARLPELDYLKSLLNKTRDGLGAVCFIAGEAGAGKTALTDEFIRQVQADTANLVAAVGSCDARTGAGDPYLPFREILTLLTGNVDSRLAQGRINKESARRLKNLMVLAGEVLVEFGPDLLALLSPGAGLAAGAGKIILSKTQWADKLKKRINPDASKGSSSAEKIDQSQIFEQYINVLVKLSKKSPLLLVLEDLHWADDASIALLFRLGRRLEQCPILIIGTYRPADIALGRAGERHPLEAVISEFKRYYGDIILDLDQAQLDRGRSFIDEYLEAEPNCLSESFRKTLFHHTQGHPLFTVELLRNMQERGDLVKDAGGCWIEGAALNWNELPSRIEGVFEERIGRLEDELRQSLIVASVEGETFTAEVLAQVQSQEVRNLVRHLSGELEKEHHLLTSQGVERLGSQRISRYRFSHNLMQAYLYGQLDEIERSYLHEDIGSTLEALYGDRAGEIAVQLAQHFELAEVQEKASRYLRLAGEQAAASHANAQAADYFTRALKFTPEKSLRERSGVLLAREQVYDLLGLRVEQAADLAILEKLTLELGDSSVLTEVSLRQAQLAFDQADYPAAVQSAERAAARAGQEGDKARQAASMRIWAMALRDQGQYEQARAQLTDAIRLAQEAQADQEWALGEHYLGTVTYYQGNYAGARAHWQQALAIFRQLDHRRGQGQTLRSLGLASNKLGAYQEAQAFTSEALRLAREVGDRQEESRCMNTLAKTCLLTGNLDQAQAYYRQALTMSQELGNRTWEGLGLMNLGFVLWEEGDYRSALAMFENALTITRAAGNRMVEVSCLENLGMASSDLAEYQNALAYFQKGLALCAEIGYREGEGTLLNEYGILQLALNQPEEAQSAFNRALALHRQMGQPHNECESLAGLVQTDLLLGNTSAALDRSDDLLARLDADPDLAGAQRRFWVHLTCFQALKAAGDRRAEYVLNRANKLLLERASAIQDGKVRRSYLDSVQAHRTITVEFNRMHERVKSGSI